jgi:hypothetical protein
VVAADVPREVVAAAATLQLVVFAGHVPAVDDEDQLQM